jgi:hypothetical protein
VAGVEEIPLPVFRERCHGALVAGRAVVGVEVSAL